MNRWMTERVKQLVLAAVCLLFVPAAFAEIGLYAGGSIGNASSEVDVSGFDALDEDEMGWKVFGGLNFDPILFDLATEIGYVDFGSPSNDIGVGEVEFDLDAVTAFGLLGFDLGPLGVFGKLGLVNWDASTAFSGGGGSFSDDSTDPAYGIGARIQLLSLEARVEYEMFDIDIDGTSSSDFNMISAGLVWRF